MTNATTTSLGEVKLAGDLAGSTNALAPELTPTGIVPGAYTLPSVTFDAKGRAISVANGNAVSVTAIIPTATTTIKGVASFPTSGGLVINNGVVSIPDATTTVKGIAKFGPEFTVVDGSVVINPQGLTAASATIFGPVKTGTNIVNTAGLISVPDASASVKGVASFNSAQFNISAGAVNFNVASLPISSSTVFGLVKTGAGVTNTDGTISVPTATASVFGLVKTGNGITNTAGTISVADAGIAVKGVASFSSNDFVISGGDVSVSQTVARTDIQNTWTKAQAYTIVPLTYAATITPNFSLSNVFSLTATGNFTLANPTNVTPGTTYLIIITQDATGGRTITWGSNFKFGLGSIKTLSTGANKRDIISVVAVSATELFVTSQMGF